MKINSDGSAFADNDTRIPFLGCLVLKETRTDPESNKSNTNFFFTIFDKDSKTYLVNKRI